MKMFPIIITVSTLLLSATASAAYDEQDFMMTETIVEHDAVYLAMGGQLPTPNAEAYPANQEYVTNTQVDSVAVDYDDGEMVINITLK